MNCDLDRYDRCIAHSSDECRWNRGDWWVPVNKDAPDPEDDEPTAAEFPSSDFAHGRCVSLIVWEHEGHPMIQYRPAIRATDITESGSGENEVDGTWSYRIAIEFGAIPVDGDVQPCVVEGLQGEEDTHDATAVANCVWTASNEVNMTEEAKEADKENLKTFRVKTVIENLDSNRNKRAAIKCNNCL